MSFKVFEEIQPYGNVVLEKSFEFSIRIVNLFQYIRNRDHSIEPLLKQILRSGTSIGANITEAQGSNSAKDFIYKLQIALKESRETEYWLRLLKATRHLDDKEFKSMHSECVELIKLLTSILKKLKSQ